MRQRGWLPTLLEQHLERHAVEDVLAGMQLEADIDARFVIRVEDRAPAPRKLGERRVDEAGRPLRPGIEERPGERAGKAHGGRKPEPARGLRRLQHLIDRPFLPRLRLAMQMRRREGVEGFVIGRMHGDELALQMRRELRHLEPVIRQRAAQLVAIRIRRGGALEIEEARIPARDLHALVAERGRPAGDRVEAVERGLVAGELRQEEARAVHRRGHQMLAPGLASARRRLVREHRRDVRPASRSRRGARSRPPRECRTSPPARAARRGRSCGAACP